MLDERGVAYHVLPGSTAYLISFTTSAPLWSVSIGQAALYYRSRFDDPKGLKLFLYVCLLMNTLQIGALAYNLYFHLITSRLPINFWLLHTASRGIPSIILHYILAFMTQSFYALRVWFVSRRKIYLVAIILVLSLAQLGGGLAATIRGEILNELAVVSSRFTFLTQGLSSVATILCDCIITISLVYFLKGPWVHPTTRFAFHKIIIFSINIGLITTIMSVLPLVIWLATPPKLFLWEPFFLPAGQIYINSILVSLNSRRSIRDQMDSQAFHLNLNSIQSYNIDRRGPRDDPVVEQSVSSHCFHHRRPSNMDFAIASSVCNTR